MISERALEALAVAIYYMFILQIGPLSLLFVIYLIVCCPIARYFAIAYLILIYYEFNEVVKKGGCRWEWWRNCYFIKLIIQYFGFQIVKTHDWDPKKNYILAGHPHGVLTVSGLIGLAYNAANVDSIFPNHKVSIITTKYNTCMPFCREMFVRAGDVYASEESMIYALTKCGPGRALCVMAGGAREGFLAEYNRQKAYIRNHKGFCRVALKSGASIVPFYAFNEVNTFKREKMKKGWWKSFRLYFIKLAYEITGGAGIISDGYKFCVPFILGMPLRTSITVVTGKPIDVEKIENPTKEQVSILHEKYIRNLEDIYNTYKHKYLSDPNQELEIL